MNEYISVKIDKRFSLHQNSKDVASRSIIDLVLDDYFKANAAHELDQDFKKWVTVQMRLFLFAGHDSTFSSLLYGYDMLSKHPNAMEQIRAE